MSNFRCVLCTPTEKLFDADVAYASVPGEDGMFGVQAGHELLVSLTGRGGVCTINMDEAGSEKREFLVFKGASQMYNGILTILASFGIETKNIDRAHAEEQIASINTRLEELKEKNDVQDKARISINKRNREWYEFQLDYLKNHPQN